MAHKKVYTNGMLQLRKFYKALTSYVGLLCMENGEMMNNFFLLSLLTLGLWHIDFPNLLTWTRFLLGVFVTWWSSHIRDWEAPLEATLLGKPLVSRLFGLFGGKKMGGFFKARWGLQRLFGISFISFPPFGPLSKSPSILGLHTMSQLMRWSIFLPYPWP